MASRYGNDTPTPQHQFMFLWMWKNPNASKEEYQRVLKDWQASHPDLVNKQDWQLPEVEVLP